ncbi:MAG: FAD-binding oxidoreductase [Bacteroidales bacterium]|nr:FAD-binding oxidoreductase [Bacteroidales bacterium]
MDLHIETLAREGFDVETSLLYRRLYATDASVYKEYPQAVVYPKHWQDVKNLVDLANQKGFSLIARGAGTSLAGQVVGNGVVIDFSRYMTHIIELNVEEHWVRIEPGVILDELNRFLRPYHLFFGPETSTSSRCTLGGMLGNNSCGSRSLIYGSVRDHVIEVDAILSDGSLVNFGPLTISEWEKKLNLTSLEGEIYRQIHSIISDEKKRNLINTKFPHPEIKRRNAGYPLDIFFQMEPYGGNEKFNLAKFLAGSEGTLALVTNMKLNLVSLPPSQSGVVCVHCHTLKEALLGNLVALETSPTAVELMDKTILDLASKNPLQHQNRSFVEGDPAAILLVEYAEESEEKLFEKVKELVEKLKQKSIGYYFPFLRGKESQKIWDLRKAGLGVLTNHPGDAKPVAVIEDVAVRPEDLPAFVEDIQQVFDRLNLFCVYYAHVGAGELHLRPMLNLKDVRDVIKFKEIAYETAEIVKKYRGSISGEHGDGRLRAELLPIVFGPEIIDLFKAIKKTFDPNGILNPGKILDAPPLTSHLRYETGKLHPTIPTLLDFSQDGGILRAVERCNGSGDCRKPHTARGGMCPSYQATWDEKNSTRARANTLREILTLNQNPNPFNHPDLYKVLDLCLSCKLCKAECPSNIDMAAYKAEFLFQWYKNHRVPLRTLIVAYFDTVMAILQPFSKIYNKFRSIRWFSRLSLGLLGFSPERKLFKLSSFSFRRWARKNLTKFNASSKKFKRVYLFVDEFTNRQDVELGIVTVKLLTSLGYEVIIPKHDISGRTFISKGLLARAQKIAEKNVKTLASLVSEKEPLVGIEPSAILSFRDEYPQLCRGELKNEAMRLASCSLLLEELIVKDYEEGYISRNCFTTEEKVIYFHGHCQQKALVGTDVTRKFLSIPENYEVHEIPSGCCGMAGSFGYEKEHYSISRKIGELILFPFVRKIKDGEYVVASGISCRQQIMDGTQRVALHPVEILWDAFKNKG